jgi:prevent-host-death family protein
MNLRRFAQWLRRAWQAARMKNVDIKNAQAEMDHLIREAEEGSPFTISVDGKPVVKVSRIEKDEIEQLPRASEDEAGPKSKPQA